MTQQPGINEELTVAQPLGESRATTGVNGGSPSGGPVTTATGNIAVNKAATAKPLPAAKPLPTAAPLATGTVTAVAKSAEGATTASAAPAAPAASTASSQAAPADAVTAAANAEATPPGPWQLMLHDWMRAAPAWLASMVVHMVILLSLGLIFIPEVRKEVRQLVATSAVVGPQDEITEMPLDSPVEEVQSEMAQEGEPLSEPLGTADGVEGIQGIGDGIDVASVSDVPGNAMNIEMADIGAAVVAGGDLTKEVGGIVGRGLEGRGQSARRALVASGGGNAYSEAAVEAALDWIARHQNPDGSWSFDHTKNQCQRRCGDPGNIVNGNLGATALAVLPFLGAGQTHKEGKYQRNVQMGLYYLTTHMKRDPNGGSLMDEGVMYSHGIGAICLCEAFAMTQDRDLMAPAQLALNFIVYAQDKVGGGWRYAPGQPGDTSVVGWQLMALKSGHMAYLNVPPQTVAGVSNFLNSTQSDSGSTYGYTGPGAGAGTTAVGLLCRMYLGWKKDHPALERGVQLLSSTGPSDGNVYYNYYATQVMHHFGGEPWEKWNKVMRDRLIATQSKAGHEAGSWFFNGSDHGAERGGRLYITSLCCMTLEVYYRHLPIYGKSSIENEFNEAAADQPPPKKK